MQKAKEIRRNHPIKALFGLLCVAGFNLALFYGVSEPSELWIRKSILSHQQNRALISVTGHFDHLAKQVHSLADDCDLHARIRTKEIRVPVVGEFMNACIIDLVPDSVASWTKNSDKEIEGVFRIWFEHAGKVDEVLSEEDNLAPYKNSNPDHTVEIQPITKVGSKTFTNSIGSIRLGDQTYRAKGVKQLESLKKRKITVYEADGTDGDVYVSISSGCCLPNYFLLTAVLKEAPTETGDGHLATIDIKSGNKTVAKGIRLFSIKGTNADNLLMDLEISKKFTFWGITRMDLSGVLELVESGDGEQVNLPFEFVL